MASGATAARLLAIDGRAETERIAAAIRQQTRHLLKRRGVVIGISGGIDSSVAAALCARALGPERVLGLLMPERESSSDSLRLGRMITEYLGIQTLVEEITPILEAAGCYSRRDAAIKTVVPHFGPGYKSKIVLPANVGGAYRIFSVVVESPDGVQTQARLTAEAYLGIVAASNFKQRVRKMMEYHHADRLHYAVVGTPNRLEYDQGFFVKNGDGAADLKPIAHLYKTQVYQLAEALGIPEEIRRRPPTTDTYTLAQSQDEFYFSVSHETLDACLFGLNEGLPVEVVAAASGLSADEVRRVCREIESKRRATAYLHQEAQLAVPLASAPAADAPGDQEIT